MAAESPCHKIRGSARLAGVGLLIALLSALGCCSQAPGRAAKLQAICSWAVLPLQRFGACDQIYFYFITCHRPRVVSKANLIMLLL